MKREVKEETGNTVEKVLGRPGVVLERTMDKYEKEAVFEMESHYYFCSVSDQEGLQKLDDYEAELEFSPVWINIDKAIKENEGLLSDETIEKNPWVKRETIVLKAVREYYLVTNRKEV